MSHSCVEVYLHIIFSTKDRENIIPEEIEKRLYAYFGGIAHKRQVIILKMNGTGDHVHILLKLHSTISISVLMKELKSYSTSWIKKQGYDKFSWQEGYGAFSCSISHVAPLMKYIDNQKQHHKIKTFEEEIAMLNKRWGIKWMNDEK